MEIREPQIILPQILLKSFERENIFKYASKLMKNVTQN